MCDIGQCANIANLCQRVGRRLSKQEFGVGLHRLFPSIGIGLRYETGGHTKLSELRT